MGWVWVWVTNLVTSKIHNEITILYKVILINIQNKHFNKCNEMISNIIYSEILYGYIIYKIYYCITIMLPFH